MRTDHLGTVSHAHHKAGEVVVIRSHHTRVLGHLATYQGAAALAASLGDSRNNLSHMLGAQLADGDIVKEEQRLCTGYHDVIHAHGHQVLAHRVVAVKQLRDGELGANAVGTADQHRLFHVLESCSGEE